MWQRERNGGLLRGYGVWVFKERDRQHTKQLGSVGNFSQDNLQWFSLENKFFLK